MENLHSLAYSIKRRRNISECKTLPIRGTATDQVTKLASQEDICQDTVAWLQFVILQVSAGY